MRVAGLLALLWVVGCGSEPPGNVLLVTVDTLRADHVGTYGYERSTTPNVDRFFREGRVYARTYATSSFTPPSVVTILSGHLPKDHGVRRFLDLFDRRVPLVCDLLGESFETAAFVSNAVLSRESLGIADCFDHYDDYVDEREGPVRKVYERNAARTTDAALAWLDGRAGTTRRLLVWVHYIDPHGPYEAPGDADVDFRHEGTQAFDRRRMPLYADLGTDDALEVIDRYDEEIAYTDREIGRLLEGWQARSGGGRDLVIFTADHGESLVERKKKVFDHGFHVWEEQLRVPLLLRAPGVEAGTTDAPASLVDVLPTILGFAGVPAPPGLPGVDLLAGEPPAERMLYAEAPEWAAVVRGSRKWVARYPKGRRPARTLERYDLARDPGETDPKPWDRRDPATRWMRELERSDPRRRGEGAEARAPGGRMIRQPKVAPGATEEQLEQLRGLGYVE